MILLDAHVHIYGCFDKELLLSSAYANFQAQAKKLNCSGEFTGVLLLADRADQDTFLDFHTTVQEKRQASLGEWHLYNTDEPYTLKFSRNREETLYLVQGWQLISNEGLEVLSLITDKRAEEGFPLVDQIVASNHNNGITVLPWALASSHCL